jgi:glycosyltransferase involved in cell wall biosynthesis
MKIAIVAPSPVPFGVGGAEKLWWGMLEFINKHTVHQCELIKIPIIENSFWDLIDAYYSFYTIDLSCFDMVITGKYPGWMVEHPNHHVYMLHCLRGFYDCYHLMGLPDEVATNESKIVNILSKLKNDNTTIKEVFVLLFEMKNDQSVSEAELCFPGAFIKHLVHFFDRKAMEKVTLFSAISGTVASRKEYFPIGCKVNVIYPPSVLTQFKNASSEYFFTVSRLDGAKRIEMLVKAYMASNTQIPLKIAGTGPLSEKIAELIKNDSRVELLGFVSDDTLIEYYSHAYAIIFVPYDEDYGLVTIEAMMCEKPVLSFSDAGGVVEFVEDQVTGLVCEPSVEKLTANIDYIAKNPELCKRMGEAARKKVQNITWANTLGALLNEPFEVKTETPKKKITVVTTYPIYPPRGGGQNRIFYLYKELAKSMLVDIICLAHEHEEYKKSEIAPNLFEVRVPKSKNHAEKEWRIEEKAGIPVTDIAMLYLYNETPLFVNEVKASSSDAQVVVLSHPYLYNLIQEHIDKPIIHESHNVEYNLKKQMLENTSHNQELLKELYLAEKAACQTALLTTVCAMDDAITIEALYQFDASKAVLVPNGVDLHSVSYLPKDERVNLKKSLGLKGQKIVLFIGSWHQPNIDAVEEIFKIAIRLPDYNFIVMGSVGDYFAASQQPKNIGFAGVADDDEKELYLSIADVAINPMLTGSGTNLKMLDYMANGIPVISTEVGARGLGIPKGLVVTCDVGKFDHYIKNIEQYVDIERSREYVENIFSWTVIGNSFREALVTNEIL